MRIAHNNHRLFIVWGKVSEKERCASVLLQFLFSIKTPATYHKYIKVKVITVAGSITEKKEIKNAVRTLPGLGDPQQQVTISWSSLCDLVVWI